MSACRLWTWPVPWLDSVLRVSLLCLWIESPCSVVTLTVALERPESSLTLLLLDGPWLFMPGFLRNCYFFIEVRLRDQDTSQCWTFWMNFSSRNIMWCGLSSACLSDHMLYYVISYFSIQYFFHSMFGFLCIGDPPLCSDFSVFFICVLGNYPSFSSSTVTDFHLYSSCWL